MNLTGAIEILKLHKHTTDKFKHSVGDQYVSDAIDTVVAYCENPLPTDEETIERLWKQYRVNTNNEDAWCFKKLAYRKSQD